MTERQYLDYIQDIIESVTDIESFVSNMDFDAFCNDKKTINAVIRSLEVIGEASTKIPSEISDRYPAIPWKQMRGMRNKLFHEYFGVDKAILWQVATDEIPHLGPIFSEILMTLE
jgi:uncharacterized protein with HEPN domain